MASFYYDNDESIRLAVEDAISISGLGERLKEKTSNYSKGMRRRLLLARTLMVKPKLAILDEPTSGLDVTHAYHLRKVIKSYSRDHGMTVLISSHNMLEVEYLCDRVALIDKGRIIEIGSPDFLKSKYSAVNLEDAFMRVVGLPKGLRLLVLKKVKDLLKDPKILIGMILFPALILPIVGAAINLSTGSLVEKSSEPLTVHVLDEDGSTIPRRLLKFLVDNNVEIRLVEGAYEDGIRSVANGGVLIVLPEGLSQVVQSGGRGEILIFYGFKDFSILESLNAQRVSGLLSRFENLLVRDLISESMPKADPDSTLNPLSLTEKSVIKGVAQPVSPYVLINIVRMQGIMGPLVIMIVLILAMQVAATSIAIEKEAKTLETLLTMPVSRLEVLSSKLVGSVAIALLATVANVFAFTYYISSITSQAASSVVGLDLASLGLVPLWRDTSCLV